MTIMDDARSRRDTAPPLNRWMWTLGLLVWLGGLWTTTAVAADTLRSADAGRPMGGPADTGPSDTGLPDTGPDDTRSTDVHDVVSRDAGTRRADVQRETPDEGLAGDSPQPDTSSAPPDVSSSDADSPSSQQTSSDTSADSTDAQPSDDQQASDQTTSSKQETAAKRGPPTISKDSLEDGPGPPRPMVLTASVPHLLLAAVKGPSGTYWPMLELTLELQQAPRLSIAPIAGGMFVTTDFGTSGVLSAGVQGRAYITETFNNGIYGAAEIMTTGAIGSGSADPTLGVPFIYSGVSPSLLLGVKLNIGGGFIMDSQVGLGLRNLLADELSIFDVDVDPAADLTLNINLGWGFKR